MLAVVGGHSRNIGKTSVVAGIVRALPEFRWTAVKITQYGHGKCADEGDDCACSGGDLHPYMLDEETAPNKHDSGRFLAAGAERAFWLRTAQGQLGNGIGPLKAVLAQAVNSILESNSVLQFLRPDIYIVVLDPSVSDMKDSTRRYFDRADAFAIVDRPGAPMPWDGIPQRWLKGKPRFSIAPPGYSAAGLADLVRAAGNRTIASNTPSSDR